MDQAIREAIADKRLLEFQYHGHSRVCEPHVYGHHSGCDQVLVYQVGGSSSSGGIPNWRRVKVGEMVGLRLLEKTFPGQRQCPSGMHSSWDMTYCIVT